MTKQIEHKLLMIQWLDHSSYSSNGWHSGAELAALVPAIVTSVGWVIHDKDGYLVLAAHYNPDDDAYGGDMCILKNDIVKRWVLKNPSN